MFYLLALVDDHGCQVAAVPYPTYRLRGWSKVGRTEESYYEQPNLWHLVSCALWPLAIRRAGRSEGMHFKNTCLNHFKYKSLSIQPDFWGMKRDPAGTPSCTCTPYGTLPFRFLKINIGGRLLPAAEAHATTVTFPCCPWIFSGHVLHPSLPPGSC